MKFVSRYDSVIRDCGDNISNKILNSANKNKNRIMDLPYFAITCGKILHGDYRVLRLEKNGKRIYHAAQLI